MTAPILVAWVDLDRPLPTLSPERDSGPAYRGAWVLAAVNHRPVGLVEYDFAKGPLPPAGVEALFPWALPGARNPAIASHAGEDLALHLPTATVVVPTVFERLEQLVAGVEALAGLDYPDFEVIVVDNRPASRVDPVDHAALRRLPGVRVITEPQPGISAARNRGVAAASGEIVAFTDDDVRVHPQWLRAIGARFGADPEIDCVTGLVLPRELETPAQVNFEKFDEGLDKRFQPEIRRLVAATAPAYSPRRYRVAVYRGDHVAVQSLYQLGGFMGANMAFRKDALRALGPFDVSLGTGTPSRGGEDIDMIVRLLFAGRTLAYEPMAVIHHRHRSSYQDLAHQLRGYGTGFTAMLAALVRHDRRHLLGLADFLGQGVARVAGRLVRRGLRRHAGSVVDVSTELPAELRREQVRGLLDGPRAYRRARQQQGRWSR